MNWSEAERWSPGSFCEVAWNWPREVIRPLSAALCRRFEPVDREEHVLDSLTFGSLHFTGELSYRDMSSKLEVKGKLFFAHANDVVYSKIDARNGAIGIVPESMPRVAFSSEYPIYEVDPSIALPQYVKLLFRMDSFRERINSLISGASGRKRVEPSTLESIEVPLPPLATQRAIVAHWQATQIKNAAAFKAADEHETEVEKHLLQQLGFEIQESKTKRKCFSVKWQELERWSVEFHQYRYLAPDPHAGSYPASQLGDIASVSYGIQKAPSNRPGAHPRPYLRVANVQRGALDLKTIKFINVPPDEFDRFRLFPGDLLVCEGNSADLVGRPAIWNGEIDDCVHQNHLLRVRAQLTTVLPEFLLHWMSLPPARAHFRSRAKATTNLSSINSVDLRELPVVLPPLSIQKQLVAEVTAARAHIAAERAAAAKLAADTAREVEQMILGQIPVSA